MIRRHWVSGREPKQESIEQEAAKQQRYGMPDQNTSRSYRSHEPQSYGGSTADDGRGGGTDPLAELARLIGQTDPFADLERERHRTAQPQPAPEQYPQQYYPADPQAAAQPQAIPQSYASVDPQAQGYDLQAYEQQGYDPQAYAAAYQEQGYAPHEYPPGYEDYYSYDGVPLDEIAYHEEMERKGQRRRRIVMVAAVLALVVVGGAGAVGYRQFFSTTGSSGPPPVIKASTTPAKVVPPNKAKEARGGKLIQDRVNDRASVEKLEPREEKPVEIKKVAVAPAPPAAYEPAASAAPIAPRPTTTIPIAAPPPKNGVSLPVASTPSTGSTSSLLPPPKKVRTVTIRPDMTIVPNTPEPPRALAPPPVQVPQTRSATPWPAPASRAAPAARAAAPPPPARAAAPAHSDSTSSTRSAAVAPRAETSPRTSRSPQQSCAAVAIADGQCRTGRCAAANSAIAKCRQRHWGAIGPGSDGVGSQSTTSPKPSSGATGGRVCGPGLIAAQRSRREGLLPDAAVALSECPRQTAQPFVRRVDLGSSWSVLPYHGRAVCDRRAGASLCSSLKAAGGQCIIHRN